MLGSLSEPLEWGSSTPQQPPCVAAICALRDVSCSLQSKTPKIVLAFGGCQDISLAPVCTPGGSLNTWRTCVHPCWLLQYSTHCVPCLEQGIPLSE